MNALSEQASDVYGQQLLWSIKLIIESTMTEKVEGYRLTADSTACLHGVFGEFLPSLAVMVAR